MSYYLGEIRLNKNRSGKSENNGKRKRLSSSLVALALISLLVSAPIMFFSNVAVAAEPTLDSILNDLGFTNIALIDVQTFSPGIYNVTLYAEFAGYHDRNMLSYYPVNTTDFYTIFTGPEGATGNNGGYVEPPLSTNFTADTQFGLSMLTPDHRYFTEHYLNPDYPITHARVYRNLDAPSMLLIGFENFFGQWDRDYNDMVFSLVPVAPLEIINVTRAPETPNYDQSVKISAEVMKGDTDIESVILGYQIESASWINVTMSLEGGFYVANIPAQPYGTTVNYQVYASDEAGYSDVSDLFSYVVGDFVPPVITDVQQVPSAPDPYEFVAVSAKVTEPVNASGVQKATLWFTAAASWASVTMTLNGGVWTGTIPGLTQGVYVKYYIQAFDNAGNDAKTPIFDYSVNVPNVPPVALFSQSASTVYTGEVIDFNASASYDPDGTIVSYEWNFGDGSTDSGVAVSHSYEENGTYSVMLTVTDDDGATGSKTVTITVKNRPPVAKISTSTTILDKEEIVTFDASESYDPDGTIVSYEWNFGDGTTGTGVEVEHAYENDGTYTVTLTVTDNDGATDTATVTKTVRNQSPVASFTESAHTVNTGETIYFDASDSYDPDGTIVSYEWNFGDGTTGTGVTVQHSYSQNGIYTVTLTVTDDDGATDTDEATKTVENQGPVAAFTESAHTVDTDEKIYFDASDSYDPDGTIVSYVWDFGDGTTATGITASHAYAENGSYTVTLTVEDNDGATDSASDTKTVVNKPPVASFTESAHTVDIDETIYFDASDSYDLDGSIVSYSWDFGDGNTATGVEAEHAYQNDGAYTVTLTVTDNDGATDTATATKTVLSKAPVPPVALFTENATLVKTDETIHFNASDSYDPDGTIVSYEWDFGDGTTGTGVEVDHAYTEVGDYTVTLTVTDNDGETDSTTDTITVEESGIDTELESALPLSILSVIILGITALTATILYGLFIRRKKKKKQP